MNSGLREQDEAGEMESGLVVRTDSPNAFWQLNRLRPAAPWVLFLHPALPERAQGGVVERKAGCNLPQMIVMGR
jgi:hypothetical protein